ncbi:MAG: recombinase family protein [Flavobacterium sp.]|uniref:recombinase family protein n=1 Tax=Flavobacterium sp. TaxID=239 RepID=UPI003BBA1711
MKVFYSRVSSSDGTQKPDRQLQNIEGFDYVLTDYCSGSIPLYERPKGSQIKSLIDQNKLSHLEIHDFSRLGRSTLDCLTVYKELTQLGIRIVCRNPNIVNIGDDGKPEIFSELLLSLLSVLNSYEKSLIRERQMEGIRIRKEKGLYSGRRIGTTISDEKFLSSPKSKTILSYLEKGYTFQEISKIVPCSRTTVQKVSNLNKKQTNQVNIS